MSNALHEFSRKAAMLLGAACVIGGLQMPVVAAPAADAAAPVQITPNSGHHRRYHHYRRHHHRAKLAPAGRAMPTLDKSERAKINSNTVYVIAGRLISSYLRMTAEMSAAVDDGDNLRVLPMIGEGALHNIYDILYLKGVDVGILRLDSLESVRRSGDIPGLGENLKYLTEFGNDEMHVIAPANITDIHQLAGKRVNVDIPGSGTNFSATAVFKKLGIDIVPVHLYEKQAFVQMHQGKVDADVSFGAAPLSGIAQFENADKRFHLIGVPYDKSLDDYYLPSQVSGKEYPNLLGKDEKVPTIAVGTMLAVFNLAPGSARYDRVAHFVTALFDKFPIMKTPPRHPAWKEINISATIPGWTRFKPAQDWIDKTLAAQKAAQGAVSANPPGPNDNPKVDAPKNVTASPKSD
ncbi:MAG: hypothetical protein KGJ29_10975 [Hyphomicrobiales bacterium]|nr:hypothetical protein [Hyphomicrobiales bacterium]